MQSHLKKTLQGCNSSLTSQFGRWTIPLNIIVLEAEQPLTSYFSGSDSGPTFPAFDISHLRRRGWEHHATVVPQILFSQIFTQIFFTLICSYLSTTNISESGMFAVLSNIFHHKCFFFLQSGICAMLAKLVFPICRRSTTNILSRDESTTNIVQSGIYTVLEKDGTYNVHLTPKKGSSPDFKMGWVVWH